MLTVDGIQIALNHFPDGTLLIKGVPLNSHLIEWKFENNEELVALYFITRHLQSFDAKEIHLVMHYIPNARQDRVKTTADVFTLEYFAELINSLNFTSVSVLDAHSQVSLNLLENVHSVNVTPYLHKALKLSGLDQNKDIIFYPDNGAKNRYANKVNFPHAYGEKVREWETGKIIGLDVVGNLPKEPFNVLIIDDISSYGGTFYHSALKLKELGADKIYLYVTHAENSILQGDLIKSGLLSGIFTTNSLFTGSHELITILEI